MEKKKSKIKNSELGKVNGGYVMPKQYEPTLIPNEDNTNTNNFVHGFDVKDLTNKEKNDFRQKAK